jgi:hypothetical protein
MILTTITATVPLTKAETQSASGFVSLDSISGNTFATVEMGEPLLLDGKTAQT